MSRVFQTAEGELREQFYDWEPWGRRWAVWDRPVHLEPPFRPFYGHYVSTRVAVDDGRHHTFLSSIAALFTRESIEQSTTAAVAPIEPDTEPRYVEEAEHVRSFFLHVPRDHTVKPDAMAAWVATLRAARCPLAFEIVGARGQVAL